MSDTTRSEPKRRGGRPSQGKDSGAFKFRVTAVLREKLEADAEAVGRPVSEIIERRLHQSFERDALLDPSTKILGEAVAMTAGYHQLAIGKSWTEDAMVARYIFVRIKNLLATRMQVKLDPADFDDEREAAEAAEVDAFAEADSDKEASLGRRWPSADEGDGKGILVRLLDMPVWPTKLKDRFR